MISKLFLGASLLGADWVLICLILISFISVTLILERLTFYGRASKNLDLFRKELKQRVSERKWTDALKLAESRAQAYKDGPWDLETGLAIALVRRQEEAATGGLEVLKEVADYEITHARTEWDKNLSLLATIGSNAPFVGLFGTVLGIIKAFHDLSQQVATGAQTVSSGISEALIATAVGILVAIPAVVAFNLFQRRVKRAASEAEATKSFLLGELGRKG
jgi:biopolymer transport protein ExbB